MEPRRSPRAKGETQWQEYAEALQDDVDQALSQSIVREQGGTKRDSVLDQMRRVADHDRRILFVRAAPTAEHLYNLSAAGILRTRQRAETLCRINIATGERLCVHNGQPGVDCRLPSCKYADLMRMRLVARLREAYARERRKCAGL